jgi:hypothetical protein
MRFLFAILALGVVACASSDEDNRFRVGSSPRSYVIIGVAESAANTSASYDLLWRRLDATGGFERLDDDTSFMAETNERGTIRIRGIPGEFTLREVEPGTYALDSVFGLIRADRVNYIADGLIRGPERPAFDVRPGEAVYLGIWQVDLEEVTAVTRPWRLSDSDLRAVLEEQDEVLGDVRMRETGTRAVACTPRRMNNQTQRQVC